MKKIAIIMTALILAVLTGCPDPDPVREDPAPGTEERAAVKFSTGISTDRSVGRAVGTSWESDDAIGVFMLESGETAVADNASNRRYVTSGGDGSFAPANGDAVIYYPADRRGVDFIAYYPYTVDMAGFEYPVDVSNQTDQAMIDLMTADRVSAPAQNASPVPLTFKHRLSRVLLEIKPGTNLTDGDLMGLQVEITGQKVTGRFDINANAFTSQDAEERSILLKMAENGKSGEGIILPGDPQAGRQLICTLGSRRFRYTIPAAREFMAGTWNKYTITLNGSSSSSPGEEDISAEAVIDDWGPGWEEEIDLVEDTNFNVSNLNEWNRAVNIIKAGGDNKTYTINIIGDFDIFSSYYMASNTFGAVSGLNVSLKGSNTITLFSTGSLLSIGANQSIVLQGPTLKGDNYNTNGSMVSVHVGGRFTMESGEISGNGGVDALGSGYAGGVAVWGGSFIMKGGKISGNYSSDFGGGVSVLDGSFTMEGGKISGNTALGDYGGGGVYVGGGSFIMTGGEISENIASSINGTNAGVAVSSGSFIMKAGKISDHFVGVAVSGGNFTMESGEISENFIGVGFYRGNFTMKGGKISGHRGAGVSISGGNFIMKAGEISGNTATGGVNINGGNFTMEGGKISGNTSESWTGGGVDVSGNGSFIMKAGEISGNTASSNYTGNGDGGGVYVRGNGSFILKGGKISGNTASGSGGGGGVYVNGSFTMEGGEISGNTASEGGGVYVESGSLIKTGGVITGWGSDQITGNRAVSGRGHTVCVSADGYVIQYLDKTVGADKNLSTANLSGWTE